MELYFTYLIFFAVTLIIGGLFCIGLWNSSDGEDSVKPNGENTVDWAMIFYPIKRYFTQTKKEKIYYKDEELKKIFDQIKCDYRQHDDMMKCLKFYTLYLEYVDKTQHGLWEMLLCDINKKYKTKSELAGEKIKFYKEYDVPKFNQYIVKPLIGCYKCYASFWGTLIFVLSTLFALRVGFIPLDYYVLVPMWVVYVFALVNVNIYFEKKFGI